MNPLLLVDNYKLDHFRMYPEGMSRLYSNLTPRKSRIEGVEEVVVFGIQHFIKEYLIENFGAYFFRADKEKIINQYKKHVKLDSYKHIEDLYDLGYLPIEIKALEEGTRCPIGVPLMTITNTHPDFAWLVNYLETLISTQLWQGITSATIADQYRQKIDKWSLKTTNTTEGNEWIGHDFSMRGMSSVESSIMSGMAHLLSFNGTDVVPAIYQMEKSYNVDNLIAGGVPATEHSVMCMGTKEDEIKTFRRLLQLYPTGILSVVSDTWDLWKVLTEYLPILKDEILARDGKLVIRPDSGNPADIICGTGTKYRELKYFPEGEVLPKYFEDYLLDEVSAYTPHGEHGVVEYEQTYIIRGEIYKAKIHNISWNRHDKQYYYIDMYEKAEITVEKVEQTPEHKGVVELLWDVFGGTINEQGYKVLDAHIGMIYGDSIGLHNLDEINSRLEAKGFATTNWVAGFGSYGYQYNTRDTFGFAIKATYGEIIKYPEFITKATSMDNIKEIPFNKNNKSHLDLIKGNVINGNKDLIEAREIFKDPITDDGTKRSKKGLLQVLTNKSNNLITVHDQQDWEQESKGLLKTVFKDSKLVKETSLEEIRNRLKNN